MPTDFAVGDIVRHTKHGIDYVIVAIGRMQTNEWHTVIRETVVFCGDYRDIEDVGPSVDMREVITYRSVVNPPEFWTRPRAEFEDGRFELIMEADSRKPGVDAAIKDSVNE